MSRLQIDTSYRQIVTIALPISFALLVPQFNFIINNVFLGHLSEQALATASITGVYYLIFAGIGFGLNNGMQALISRRAGENRPEEIGKIFNHGVIISLFIAAAGIFITYSIAPFILKQTIHETDIYQKAVSFLQIRIWGLPFLYVYQLRNALLVGINQSKYLVTGTIAEAVSNIFFDYVLIFGKWGFPEVGFNGAAIASIISEFMGMFVIFLVIHQKGISKQFALFKRIPWDKNTIKSILNLSGPLIFQHAISIISWWFFFILIERNVGRTGLAVSNTMRNIFGFFGIFVWAFGSATNSMVSNIIGQGKSEQVVPLIYKIISLSTSLTIVICSLLNFFPHWILSIYGQGSDFMQAAIPVLRVVSLAMVLMSLSTVWLNAVIGSGNSRVTFIIECVTIVLYSIYVLFVLEWLQLNLVWGWISEWLYWIMMLSLSFLYIRSGKWKKKVI
ncbi:MAG: MATE family efflux transporter [Flavisolibacter sp.]|nr:MATE family efflux transporter [Flavisolibacter sp.]